MKVNIYTSLNGVGLERDYILMKGILESGGHSVAVSDWQTREGANHAAVAFHLEVPRYELLSRADRNIILPNAEWFARKWLNRFNKFDEVWCKTADCNEIFKPYNENRTITGFVSEDLYMPEIIKRRIFIHIAGKSTTKGTAALVEVYKCNKGLPTCFLISTNDWGCRGNLIQDGRIGFDDLKVLINSAYFGICTSEYEGWGHYIHEALGCKAVVLTTDSAPMNEFITDKRLLVPENGVAVMNMAYKKLIKHEDLHEKMLSLQELSDKELDEIGEQNRATFLDRNAKFTEFLLTYINQL